MDKLNPKDLILLTSLLFCIQTTQVKAFDTLYNADTTSPVVIQFPTDTNQISKEKLFELSWLTKNDLESISNDVDIQCYINNILFLLTKIDVLINSDSTYKQVGWELEQYNLSLDFLELQKYIEIINTYYKQFGKKEENPNHEIINKIHNYFQNKKPSIVEFHKQKQDDFPENNFISIDEMFSLDVELLTSREYRKNWG